MTDELNLDAIEARANAATPGPWEPYFTVHGHPHVVRAGQSIWGVIVSISPDDYGRADCEFLAAARSDVPALVAEVRRLRAENRNLRSAGVTVRVQATTPGQNPNG